MEMTFCTSQAKRNVSAQALNDSSTLAFARSAGLKLAAGNVDAELSRKIYKDRLYR
jgi:hypothetical protein